MTYMSRAHAHPMRLTFLLLLCLLTAPGLTDDWPQFRGPNRDGKSAETGLLAAWPEGGPQLLWSASGIGAGFTHASVAGGLVYVTGLVGEEGFLTAFDADGAVKWRTCYGAEWFKSHPGARSVPTVRDGLVYVTSGVGNLICLDAATGATLWTVPMFDRYEAPQVKWGYAESPLIDGEQLILTPCGKQAAMIALDRKSGEEIWRSPAVEHSSSFCSPTLVEQGGTRMFVTVLSEAVVAFSAEDGSVLWEHPYKNFRGNHPISPIQHGDLLYITSGYGKGAVGLRMSADGRSVTQVWEQPIQDPCHGQAVLLDGYVYASSHQRANGRWSCVEVETGRVAWEDPCVGKGGSVIYAGGMLYCYSEDGVLGLVRPSPDACDVVSAFPVPMGDGPHWAHPVVANGRLYVRRGDALMCYDVAAP